MRPLSLLLIIVCVLTLTREINAQQTAPPPRSVPGAKDFDFWVGEWNLSWGDTSRGTNTVSFTLDSAVVMEQFSGGSSTPLRGMSVSAYNQRSKRWQQTWVDNGGDYLDFSGAFTNGKMILSRKAELNGKEFLQRMVWFAISHDSLNWHWDRSDDNGTTWKTLWAIHYERRR